MEHLGLHNPYRGPQYNPETHFVNGGGGVEKKIFEPGICGKLRGHGIGFCQCVRDSGHEGECSVFSDEYERFEPFPTKRDAYGRLVLFIMNRNAERNGNIVTREVGEQTHRDLYDLETAFKGRVKGL